MNWWLNKNNIEFKWNDRFPINSINIMRGYLLVRTNNELKEEFLDKFFDAYWKNNKDLEYSKKILMKF